MLTKEGRVAGLEVTLENIENKKHEKELQRGFSDGGSSIEDVDGDDREAEL